jgi:hypothetical protein
MNRNCQASGLKNQSPVDVFQRRPGEAHGDVERAGDADQPEGPAHQRQEQDQEQQDDDVERQDIHERGLEAQGQRIDHGLVGCLEKGADVLFVQIGRIGEAVRAPRHLRHEGEEHEDVDDVELPDAQDHRDRSVRRRRAGRARDHRRRRPSSQRGR